MEIGQLIYRMNKWLMPSSGPGCCCSCCIASSCCAVTQESQVKTEQVDGVREAG